MDQEQNPRERSFVMELVPHWRPTRAQALMVTRTALVVVVTLLGVLLLLFAIGSLFDIRLLTLLEILAVPITVGAAVPLLNWLQKRRELEVENQRAQDEAFQAYLDQMSQLLIDKARPLHRAQRGDSLSTVARARTLTVLTRLDGERKRSVLQFLYEAELITNEDHLHGLKLKYEHQGVLVLRGADLRGANLRGARLFAAGLLGVDLRGADLRKVRLEGASLRKADLREADLRGARLDRVDLTEADLRGADLRGAHLLGADLRQVRLQAQPELSGVDLRGAYLDSVDLRGADLRGPYLNGARLREADLRGADLREANLSGAHLTEADLRGADLRGARLIEADMAKLSAADVIGADHSGVDLFEADLRRARLDGADLSGAEVYYRKQLALAASLEGATMPDGQKYEGWIKDKEGSGKNAKNE